jgi:hypothetical protein
MSNIFTQDNRQDLFHRQSCANKFGGKQIWRQTNLATKKLVGTEKLSEQLLKKHSLKNLTWNGQLESG